ncbi:MAG TPA: iron-containing alcohol dehydrogenase, partial [Thermodesulfobacteriota bacterium]|nr:iron-containing alcohol dehydrogenase [Thermodesulfobacteriota bacterium]
MNNFSFVGAGEIHFGRGAIQQLPELAGRYSRNTVLVTLDPFFSKGTLKAGLAKQLKAVGLQPVFFDKLEAEPAPTSADAGARLARNKKCKLVIGLGGGSALDTAKAIAILATNKGQVSDYVGLDRVPKAGLPTILIPTSAGTGSEVTFTAVFTKRLTKTKGGIHSRFL